MVWQTISGVLVSCLVVVEAGYCRVNSCRGVGVLFNGYIGLFLHSCYLFTEVFVSCKEMILHSDQLFTEVLGLVKGSCKPDLAWLAVSGMLVPCLKSHRLDVTRWTVVRMLLYC